MSISASNLPQVKLYFSVSQILFELYSQQGAAASCPGGRAQQFLLTGWQLASSIFSITGFQYDVGWYKFQSSYQKNVSSHSHNECFPSL